MFDLQGTLIPSANHCCFSYPSTDFYKLSTFSSAESITAISKLYDMEINHLTSKLDYLVNIIRSSSLKTILNGPSVPFFLPATTNTDIGARLENDLMPLLSKEFTSCYPKSHFKAIVQDKKDLPGRLAPRKNTGYIDLIEANTKSNLIGYYFPLALNQYSVTSQVAAFEFISENSLAYCLSGPLEISSALASTPSLLIHTNSYSPILVGSGAEHADSRLIPVFKSYGQHLEFWVLSNILTPGFEQISEQWSGGVTIYDHF